MKSQFRNSLFRPVTMQAGSTGLISSFLTVGKSVLALFFVLLFFASCAKSTEAGKKEIIEVPEPVNVKLFTVKPRVITKRYTVSAIIRGENEALVTAGISGKIKEFYVSEGNFVKKGAPVALIDPADYKLELEKATAILDGKKLIYNRLLNLDKKRAVSKAELDLAKTDLKLANTVILQAKLNLERTVLKSPIDGQITRRTGMLGKRVVPGEQLFNVLDTSRLKIIIALSEKEVVHLKTDDTVFIIVDAWPGKKFRGKVRSVRVSADVLSASFPVEISLNKDKRLKPGMVARVTLKGEVLKNLLLVPMSAVQERIGTYYIFKHEKGFARLKEVKLGKRLGKMTEIVDGVSSGDEIIPVYGSKMKDGSPVIPINKRLTINK